MQNISKYLYDFADSEPDKPAFLHPVFFTFGELVREIDRFAEGFRGLGISNGTKTVVLIKPGIEIFAVTFALLRIGAIPVLIDPGMGRKRMSKALGTAGVEAFIGIPKSLLLRYISGESFKSVKVWISTGWSLGRQAFSLRDMSYTETSSKAYLSDEEDPAAIFFTSGSTGIPKGVIYKSRTLKAQIEYMKSSFGYTSKEIDLCTFPLIGMLVICHGISLVLADMNMLRPSTLDPGRLIKNMEVYACTHMFCSPMVLKRLAAFGIENKILLSSMKRIMSAGAPVTPEILKSFRKLLPSDAEIHTPYGATEALPVTDISDKELLKLYDGSGAYLEGICVGYPLEGIRIKIIAIKEDPIETTGEAEELALNEVGEICISGPNVTEEYYSNTKANRFAKMKERGTGEVWHRTGDVGRMDKEGRLWFYGRKSQRVEGKDGTYYTIPVEAVFNQHQAVSRSALVGVWRTDMEVMEPVICIELEKNEKRKIYLQDELRTLASRHGITNEIKHFLFHRKFPVDPRHNAKIYREELTRWANNKLAL